MPAQSDWDLALDALAGGATWVTGNARLARRVLREEALRRRAAGVEVWIRGDVLPWSAWLQRLYTDALTAGLIADAEPAVLLSPQQTEALWRHVIEQDPVRGPLLQSGPAARQAMEAYALCLAWRVDRAALAAGAWHEDVAAFLRWASALEGRLRECGWMLPGALADHVPVWLRRDPALAPRALYLAGFEEWSPQQQILLAELESLGVAVHEVDTALPSAGAGRVGCIDAEDEMRAAAAWARERLARDPAARIGIVAADLHTRREALVRHLQAALDPRPGGESARRRPWNISLGHALADEPMVHDALLVLEAAGGRLDFVAASRLLRSPFVAGEVPAGARLQAELDLRARREMHCHTRDFARQLATAREGACAALARRLEGLVEEAAAGATAHRSPGHWAEHFAKLLGDIGWPGARSLDSREYQALAAWQELLGELAALGTVLAASSRAAALGELRRLAAQRLFQAQSGPAPVQVLGLLEALGQRFDHLWILGLHDEVWPQAPRPNPFLPLALQRELGLPRATAARELQFARRMTAGLLQAAPEVVASWPRRGDDHDLRPSPLIASLPERDAPSPVSDARRRTLDAARFELRGEECAPPLPPGERVGGTALLRDQSLCPFRAFAMHRLRASALDSPQTGLDPLQRGSLVHGLLERLWARVDDRRGLAALGDAGRRALVRELVQAETLEAARRRPRAFTPRLVEIENQRLEALLLEWLDCELARPDFRVVAREQRATLQVGGLRIRGRIDRTDELADGRRLVIDYKTGAAAPGDWLGDRPRDLQLPLYGMHFGAAAVAGLALAQVRARQCTWRGVVRDEDTLAGAEVAGQWKAAGGADWDTLSAQWQATAERLAGEFLAGRAEVDPLPQACRYCHLQALCRVHERTDRQQADPGGEGDGLD